MSALSRTARVVLLFGGGFLLLSGAIFLMARLFASSEGEATATSLQMSASTMDGSTTTPVAPGSTTTSTPEPGMQSVLAPDIGALVGLSSVPADDFSRDAVEQQWNERESEIGHALDIGHSFYPFDKEFPSWREEFHIQQGRIPLISWNGTDTHEISAGMHDDLIADRARSVRALGVPVMIRWFWEMDAAAKLGRSRDPQSYAAALARIQEIFAIEGADEVEWIWCPTAFEWNDRSTGDWYPGDDLVDWVCADGYNFAPGKDGAPWRDFSAIFDGFYDWAAQTGKPIMIGEFGAQERDQGEKAAWIDDVAAVVPQRYPLIKALVYFDVDRTELEGYDWRLATSSDAYEAFIRLVSLPYFDSQAREQLR